MVTRICPLLSLCVLAAMGLGCVANRPDAGSLETRAPAVKDRNKTQTGELFRITGTPKQMVVVERPSGDDSAPENKRVVVETAEGTMTADGASSGFFRFRIMRV